MPSAAHHAPVLLLLLPLPAATLLPPPLRGPRRAKLALEVGVGGPRVARPPRSTNRISTRCTDRNRCPIVRAACFPKSLSAARARSSNPPIRATPAPSSVPPRAPPAAHRESAAAGSGGSCFAGITSAMREATVGLL